MQCIQAFDQWLRGSDYNLTYFLLIWIQIPPNKNYTILKAEIFNVEDLLNKIRLLSDQKSFGILFHHYFDKLYRIALSIVKKHEIAEEVVEDVFFKFWKMKDRYPSIKNLDTYLFVSTKNGAYDYLKKNTKYTFDQYDQYSTILCDFISPERSYLVEELREQIEQAVDNLPPKCRSIYKLIRNEGLTNKQTAKVLGISVKTVENQMTIAIRKIVKGLESYLCSKEEVSYTQMATILLFCLLNIL